MSSAAYITLPQPLPQAVWLTFCAENRNIFSPRTVGRNVFYQGEVEITFGKSQGGDPPYIAIEGYVPSANPGYSLGGPPAGCRIDFDSITPPEEAERIVVSSFYGQNISSIAAVVNAIHAQFGGSVTTDDDSIDQYLDFAVTPRDEEQDEETPDLPQGTIVGISITH